MSCLIAAAMLLPVPGIVAAQPPDAPPPVTPPVAAPPQAPAPPAGRPAVLSPPGRGPMASLDVQVVISRYQKEKQVSSLPYHLAVTANAPNTSHLNMGTDVPVPTTTFTPAAPAPAAGGSSTAPPRPPTSMSYRSVGTAISCRATGGETGLYEVTIDVDDSSIFTSDQASPPMPVPDAMPVFRSFKSRNTLLLRDGQTRQYTAAADRVSGEIVRVEVTLRVVK